MVTAGLFGKIPAQGDFVRVNASDPVAVAFDMWMAEGLDAALRSGAGLLQEPIQFFFRAPGTKNALVGVFTPSSDSVGRQFPLAIFAVIDLATIGIRYSSVPVVFCDFLAGATALVAQAASTNAARLTEQLRTLALPTAADFTRADNVCRRTLDTTNGGELHRRLFGESEGGRQYYAFQTFLNACQPARGREPAKASVTLDCPIESDIDLFAWLELSRRVLGWRDAVPPFFWSEGSTPRLLLALGPAPAAIVSYLSKSDHGGAKLWPLHTDHSGAIDRARQTLNPNHRRAIDEPSASLEVLLGSLAT